MNTFFNYLKEANNELKLVTWPKQEELLKHTITTIIFVLITAVILGLVDFGLSTGYKWLLSIGG